MLKILYTGLFTSVFSFIAQNANAEDLYGHLICRTTTGEHTIESFHDFIVFDSAAIVQSPTGYSIKGKAINLKRETNQNQKCLSTYQTYESQDVNGQTEYVYVTHSRKWNTLSANRKESMFLLSCGPASTLEIFDSKAAFLKEIYLKPSHVMKNDITAGWLDAFECLIDRLN